MQNVTARNRHVYGFDLLRCAAAFLVACFHFTRILGGVEWLFPFGWVGVEIFFVISGYVIAYSAWRADPVRFLKSRFFRLYPTAWIVAVISVTIIAVVPGYYWRSVRVMVYANPANLFNSVALTGIGVSGSYWTLPVELAFYCCVFALLLIGRLSWLRNLGLALTLVSTPYIVLLTLHYLGLANMPFIEFGLSGWNALLLRHGPLFALGLYLFAAAAPDVRRCDRLGAGLAVLLCLAEIACRSAQQLQDHSISDRLPLLMVILEAELVFALALLAMMASIRWNGVFPQRFRQLSRTLGLATYPFYLLHEVVGGLTIAVLLRTGVGPAVAVASAVAATAYVAYVVSAGIEPALRRTVATVLVRASRPARAGKAEPASLGAA